MHYIFSSHRVKKKDEVEHLKAEVSRLETKASDLETRVAYLESEAKNIKVRLSSGKNTYRSILKAQLMGNQFLGIAVMEYHKA